MIVDPQIAEASIARLQAMSSQSFALVEGAAELATLVDQPPALPAAYVYLADEASGENERMSGSVSQLVHADVAVVIITGNIADATGRAAAADLRLLVNSVRGSLIGWQPDGTTDVMTHVSGTLVKAKAGVLWWEEKFATSYLLEA